jgi:hypothetical protein
MSQEDTMRFVAELIDSGQKARWPVCAIVSGIRGVNRTWPFRGGYFTV